MDPIPNSRRQRGSPAPPRDKARSPSSRKAARSDWTSKGCPADAVLGFSRFVSVGNQADVEISEILEGLVDHEPTRLVVVYCESFLSGRRVFAAAQSLVEAGKPVLMLAPGRSSAAARAAQSHTGSMTSSRDIVAAACKAAGVQLFETTADVVDSAYFMLRTSRFGGTRVGIVADGGGYGVLTADLLDARGLDIPVFSATTQAALVDAIGDGATTTNPVDLAAAAGDPAALDRAVDVVVGSGEVDSVVITGFVGDPDPDAAPDSPAKQIIVSPETASRAHRLGVPLVVQALFDDSPAVDALRGQPVAVYRTGSSIGQVFQAAVTTLAPRSGVPPLPAPAEAELTRGGYFEARELLSSYGIGFARSSPRGRHRRIGDHRGGRLDVSVGSQGRRPLAQVGRWRGRLGHPRRGRVAASAYGSRISA